jgi:O-antigen/teichoic acid export membrane protein
LRGRTVKCTQEGGCVSLYQKLSAIWQEDNLLRRVIKNSSYLFSSNVISAVLSFAQTIVAVRLIGVASWGLVAAIQTFASNINRFLSFRMSEVVLKNLGPALADKRREEAAVMVKAAGLVEAATSIAAFTVLILLAPWAARTFAKDSMMAPLFTFYGLILLINLIFETSTGILQATQRFDHLGRANLIQSIITFGMISVTYVLFRWGKIIPMDGLIAAVLLAYVIGKAYFAVSYAVVALRELNRNLDPGWWRVSLGKLQHKRELISFAINTNLNGTVNLVFRDNIQLYLAALLSLTDVGLYKIAMTLILPLTMILDPFIAPTYAEISQTIAKFEWKTTLRLLKRITVIASVIVGAYWAIWAAFGWWVIPLLYKPQSKPVYPILLTLIVGFGFASIFQWNRSLFLSLGKPGYPIIISTLVGVIELALMSILVPRYGNIMMAIILSGYFIVSVGIISLRGLIAMQHRQKASA